MLITSLGILPAGDFIALGVEDDGQAPRSTFYKLGSTLAHQIHCLPQGKTFTQGILISNTTKTPALHTEFRAQQPAGDVLAVSFWQQDRPLITGLILPGRNRVWERYYLNLTQQRIEVGSGTPMKDLSYLAFADRPLMFWVWWPQAYFDYAGVAHAKDPDDVPRAYTADTILNCLLPCLTSAYLRGLD